MVGTIQIKPMLKNFLRKIINASLGNLWTGRKKLSRLVHAHICKGLVAHGLKLHA
jgi:hypothetical protein